MPIHGHWQDFSQATQTAVTGKEVTVQEKRLGKKKLRQRRKKRKQNSLYCKKSCSGLTNQLSYSSLWMVSQYFQCKLLWSTKILSRWMGQNRYHLVGSITGFEHLLTSPKYKHTCIWANKVLLFLSFVHAINRFWWMVTKAKWLVKPLEIRKCTVKFYADFEGST